MRSSQWYKSSGSGLIRVPWLLAIALLLLLAPASNAFGEQDDAERTRAFQLYKDAKFAEALPLFEKLEKSYPDDPDVLERYGWIVISQNTYLKEPAERKEARRRGRALLVRAQKAGASSPLLTSMVEGIPEDGGNDSEFLFSKKKEVDDAMREGEAAFIKQDFPKAIEMYQRALLLDQKLYQAALFIGDCYFSTAEQRKAGEWFARAVAIDPDRETAYRYWGDSLMKQGRVTEAGDKFVEAYIAEPYSRLAAAAIVDWGDRVNIPVAHPTVEIPASITAGADGNTTINLDPRTLNKTDKNSSSAAWLAYAFVRARWAQSEFAKQYPKETTYRHSLKEETAALRAALNVLGEQKNVEPQGIDPSLQIVAKLDKEGLLESYILLAAPDAGIAKDFTAYRKENIDKLRRYVVEYLMTGGVGKK